MDQVRGRTSWGVGAVLLAVGGLASGAGGGNLALLVAALLVCAYLLRCMVDLLRGRLGLGLVALTPSGSYHRSWAMRAYLPWTDVLAVDPELLYRAVRHYHENPAELSGAAAVGRLRGWPVSIKESVGQRPTLSLPHISSLYPRSPFFSLGQDIRYWRFRQACSVMMTAAPTRDATPSLKMILLTCARTVRSRISSLRAISRSVMSSAMSSSTCSSRPLSVPTDTPDRLGFMCNLYPVKVVRCRAWTPDNQLWTMIG